LHEAWLLKSYPKYRQTKVENENALVHQSTTISFDTQAPKQNALHYGPYTLCRRYFFHEQRFGEIIITNQSYWGIKFRFFTTPGDLSK